MPSRPAWPQRAALTLWLLAALLWAPIWGQWHGVAHQDRSALVAVSDAAPTVHGEFEDGHAQGTALCQVLDHLGHASALACRLASLGPALWPAAAPVRSMPSTLCARLWWPTQPRAPPVWI